MIRERFDEEIPNDNGTRFRAVRLTEQLVRSIGEVIREGLPQEMIPDLFGIPRNIWREWIKKGEEYLDAAHRDDVVVEHHNLFAYLAVDVKKARAEYERTRIAVLHANGNREWRREISILERRDRRNWALSDPYGGLEEDYTPDEKFL